MPERPRDDRHTPAPVRLIDLEGAERQRAIPAIRDGFVGLYRWHAKRELAEVPWVRAAVVGENVAGVALLDRLVPEVGYVYYIMVLSEHRRAGIGGLLLDDALAGYRRRSVEVVYAAVQRTNVPSQRLFAGRGFREVGRREEPLWKDGGLGAWGLRSRMRIVPGEQLLGVRLAPRGTAPPSG